MHAHHPLVHILYFQEVFFRTPHWLTFHRYVNSSLSDAENAKVVSPICHHAVRLWVYVYERTQIPLWPFIIVCCQEVPRMLSVDTVLRFCFASQYCGFNRVAFIAFEYAWRLPLREQSEAQKAAWLVPQATKWFREISKRDMYVR